MIREDTYRPTVVAGHAVWHRRNSVPAFSLSERKSDRLLT
jgi:hypothetical protein